MNYANQREVLKQVADNNEILTSLGNAYGHVRVIAKSRAGLDVYPAEILSGSNGKVRLAISGKELYVPKSVPCLCPVPDDACNSADDPYVDWV
jgi:hypothetical protein